MATIGWQIYEASAGIYKASVDGMNSDGISTIIDMSGYMLNSIVMPSAWTSAALTFLLSVDGGSTYNSIYSYEGELSYSSSNAIASVSLGVKPEHAMQMQGKLKLRSGTKSAAVNQAESRTITLIAWKLDK